MRIGRHFWFFLAAIVGAVANRIRGGWLGISGGDWIFGGIYLIALLWADYTWPIAVISGVALAVSFMLGWGRYLGALGGVRGSYNGQGFHTYTRDELKENWLIDPFIAWAKFDPRLWGFMGCLLRGLVISLALCIALGWEALLIAPLFPLAYFLGASIEQVFLKRHGGFEVGEMLFGALIFLITYGSIAGL